MKIILDAMGGDNAPDAVVRGALEAAKEFGVQIVLVGRGADILASMKAQGWDTLPDGVELANAEDVVDMHCDPAAVVKQHPNSSLVLGARMLAAVMRSSRPAIPARCSRRPRCSSSASAVSAARRSRRSSRQRRGMPF